MRYMISGGTAAIVALGVLYVLTDIKGVWYLVSSTIAFVVGFFVSFALQKLWTFKNTHTYDMSRQLFLYFITALGALVLNVFFMYLLVDIAGIWYMFSQVISSGTLAIATFFIYGNIVFHHGQGGRILVATPLYPPDIGGPATYTALLEDELPSRGVSVSTVSFGGVRRLPKIIRHIIYFFKICVASIEVKTIYALDPVSVGLPSFVASKLLRKKFLLRVAGDYAWEQHQVQSEKRKAKNKNEGFVTLEEFQKKKFDVVTEMRRKIERYVARRADTVVVPSEYLKKIVKQWGVPEEYIKVVYNTFEPPALKETRESVRKKLGILGTVIFSAGRFVPWKGFETLIETVAELKKEIPDIKLFIAGDGPEREALKEQITKNKLQNTVILLGKLDKETLAKYTQAADLFALNTGYEGFSHQLLEVMAIGTPVITTDAGGNSELVENQKTGLLVHYNDAAEIKNAIRALVANGALRERLVKNGTEKARLFSKERAIDAIIKLF